MDRTTVTALLKVLERRGYVEVSADDNDRRSRTVTLTSEGVDALRLALPIWRLEHGRLDKDLGDRDPESARAALRALA